MPSPELSWLAPPEHWDDTLSSVPGTADLETWNLFVRLANWRLDFVQALRLQRRIDRLFGREPPFGITTKPVRLAVLGSSTVDHLLPAIRTGALRRGLWTALYTGDYGQYHRELKDPTSALRAWKPDTILFSLDSRHLFGGFRAGAPPAETDARFQALCENLVDCWMAAREKLGCQVIQQTAVPVFPQLFGGNEHRVSGSPAALVRRFNDRIRGLADAEGVHLLSLEAVVEADGLDAWHDPVLWHRAKQEVHPAASPVYGDLVARLLAALQGRSSKCLVLDLDNTLWGGVIGDDGLDGIVLGQGSAVGEAFIGFQQYARELARRGVILAVCSKNDEVNALEPFDKHPEMVLKRSDIACFAASWQDKVTALRSIADRLNIGLDSLVFADDNPFERALVRRELPMVAVPELPADPAHYAMTIARAGYFEGLQLTDEDLIRGEQYQSNLLRESLRQQSTDMDSYLRSLDMEMRCSPFRRVDQKRIFQLINKTNQFNLTTRRYSEEDVSAVIADKKVLSLQLRLLDRFGDNGIIGLVIGRFAAASTDMEIDTWLMSCRVLGRQVEQATLNLVVSEARALGAKRLVGRYRPTKKNGMVAEHYAKLGFSFLSSEGPDYLWLLDLCENMPAPTFIRVVEVLDK